jgi:hypothetical protein
MVKESSPLLRRRLTAGETVMLIFKKSDLSISLIEKVGVGAHRDFWMHYALVT